MNTREQYQTSHALTRVLLFTDEASVQLELYKEPRGDCNITAYVFALWVNKPARRKGVATALLDRVEQIAKDHDHKSIFLEYDKRDTPAEILSWYERRGYQEREFGSNNALLEKKLN
jgi:ribosomal protein S18 acetylase RimI-like enzyme